MSVLATAFDPSTTTVLAEGILPWFNRKGGEAQSAMRTFASLVAIGFMIATAIKTRGAMASILLSALVAGVFLFFVWNITEVRDRVGDEVNSAPPAVIQRDTTASLAAAAWAGRPLS